MYRKGIILASHADLWPYDVIRLLSQMKNYSKVFVDVSATTIDAVRLPIENKKSWFISSSVISHGMAIGGLIYSSDPKAIGITDVRSIIQNAALLESKMNSAKGKLLIFNDGGSNYIDTSRSDVPFVMKSDVFYDVDRRLEKGLGAITISTYSELKDVLKNDSNKLEIYNIKIDKCFNSVVLQRA